jgi:hypothetical protein
LIQSLVELLELGRHAGVTCRLRTIGELSVRAARNADEQEDAAVRCAANASDVGGFLSNRLKDDRAYALLNSGLL